MNSTIDRRSLKFLLVAVFLFFSGTAHASTAQLIHDTPIVTVTDVSSPTQTNHWITQKLGTGWTGTQLGTMTFRLEDNSSDPQFYIFDYASQADYDVLNSNFSVIDYCSVGHWGYPAGPIPITTSSSTDFVIAPGTPGTTNCRGLPNATIDPTHYLAISFLTTTGGGNVTSTVYGSTSNILLPGGVCIGTALNNAYPSSFTCSPAYGNFYFTSASSTFGSGGPPPISTSWITPNASSTATSTPTNDFPAWQLHATNLIPGTTYAGYVQYGGGINFLNFFGYTDIGNTFVASTSTMDISIPKQTALGSGIAGVNYTWTATSTLCDANAVNCATIGRVFFVGAPGGATLQPISGAGTIGGILNDTSTVNTTCDPNSGLVAGSLCNLGVLLFIPSPASLAVFNGLASSTQNKPPFGYFTSFQTALNGLQNASSATSSLIVMTSSTEASLDVIFAPLKVGVGWLLWLILGFWGVSRLKIFNP